MIRKFLALGLAAMMLNPAMIVGASPFPDKDKDKDRKNNSFGDTSTPIKHVVVIFGENISFDHYFGTYPNAENPSGEPKFEARKALPPSTELPPRLRIWRTTRLAAITRISLTRPATA